MSDALWPHEPQYARLPCLSPTPGVHPNSCLLSQWCHPTISSSVIPFSSYLQSFPTSQSFPMSQLFTSCGQNTGVSVLTSVLPMNTQDRFPLGWTGWISLQSKGITSWQIDGETLETVADFILGGSKITADGDCSHEIKRHLLLGRKVMTNLDSILKSRDITLSTKAHLVKAMVFPIVMYGCESWTIKKDKCRRIDALNCDVGEDSWKSLELQRVTKSQTQMSNWTELGQS